MMKTLLNLIKRAGWLYQIRSLEILIDGQAECLSLVNDPMLHHRIVMARSDARRNLAKARAEYNALLPIGQRRTWKMA